MCLKRRQSEERIKKGRKFLAKGCQICIHETQYVRYKYICVNIPWVYTGVLRILCDCVSFYICTRYTSTSICTHILSYPAGMTENKKSQKTEIKFNIPNIGINFEAQVYNLLSSLRIYFECPPSVWRDSCVFLCTQSIALPLFQVPDENSLNHIALEVIMIILLRTMYSNDNQPNY